MDDTKRQQILAEAESWLGTPYGDGETKGPNGSVDCSHLVHSIYDAKDMKYPYCTTGDFPPAAYFTKVDAAQASTGDVVLFSGHMGILVPDDGAGHRLISAQGTSAKPGKVQRGQFSWFGEVLGYYTWSH